MSRPVRAPVLYALLLRLLPRSFRAEFGDDIVALYLDRRVEATGSWRRRASVWGRGHADLVRHGLAERFPGPDPRLPTPPNRSSVFERFFADVRYALRGLRRAPAFAAAAIVTLALGIGANVAMFTAVNGVLLRPLPYAEPDRLVRVWPQFNFNKAMMRQVADAAPALEDVSGMSGWLFTLTGEGEPQQISGVLVSWNHFRLLGVRPALGRDFTAEEGQPGNADAVILSHGLWVNVFGADPEVIGRRIQLAAGDYPTRRVVGVMPADFDDVAPGYRLWSPLEVDASTSFQEDTSWYVNVLVGRLAAGASAAQATDQVRALAATLHEEWPARFEEGDARTATVESLHTYMVRDLSVTLWTLLAAVGAVLLIACVNVANLLLARGAARRRDLTMRGALGATRGRLLAQMLTESLVLGLGGGLAGLGVAWASFAALAGTAPEQYHQIADAGIDPFVLGFAFAISLGSVLVFGLIPALRASSSAGGIGTGRGAASERTATRLTGLLVAAEVALAVVLVVGASLMLRSLWQLYNDDVGFDTNGALTFRISIPEGRFEPAALTPHYQRIWEAIGAVPGVQAVGGIHLLPLTTGNWSFPYDAEGRPLAEGAPRPSANHRVVTPSYFETMRIPLLSGRSFTEQDGAGAQSVGMVNQTMAEALWPDGDVLGKRLTVFGAEFTIVGVVGDISQHGLHRDIQPEMYRPFDQWPIGGMFAIVRTTGEPMSLAASVKDAVWRVDPLAPVARVRPMDEVFGESVASDLFVSFLIAAFGALALVLGALGVYGVTAYAIGRRLREFGVRMAVGAGRDEVLRQAIGDGLKPVLLGLVLGVCGALWAARLLSALLYEVGAADPLTFVGVPAVLTVVAALACTLPAWRASRLDPVSVLRHE